MGSHPGCCCLGFPVGQNLDHLTCLQIDDNRAVGAPTPKRKVINADRWSFSNWRIRQRHDASENGLSLRLDAEPAAGRQPDDLDDRLVTRERLNKWHQTFCKDFAGAGALLTNVFSVIRS